uniref:Uncharacterized protein n=1 Tax=Anopheles minimus TaxID=112268 RepID=A0A182WMV0_9DIPT
MVPFQRSDDGCTERSWSGRVLYCFHSIKLELTQPAKSTINTAAHHE